MEWADFTVFALHLPVDTRAASKVQLWGRCHYEDGCADPEAQLLGHRSPPGYPIPRWPGESVSYLVQLLGPGGKACMLGSQASRSLGSVLLLIVLEQKERAP